MNFARKIARKQGKRGPKGRPAAAPPRVERRMPEKGEKFVLAGTDWVSPTIFTIEGYTDDGRAIIRFATAADFATPVAPGLPAPTQRPAIIQTGVSA